MQNGLTGNAQVSIVFLMHCSVCEVNKVRCIFAISSATWLNLFSCLPELRLIKLKDVAMPSAAALPQPHNITEAVSAGNSTASLHTILSPPPHTHRGLICQHKKLAPGILFALYRQPCMITPMSDGITKGFSFPMGWISVDSESKRWRSPKKCGGFRCCV